MRFIDVGFKQFGSSIDNNYYFKTIFFGLNDSLEEIDLYSLEEVYNNDTRINAYECVLNYLSDSEYNNLLKIINYKKMYYKDKIDHNFVDKIRSSNHIKKKELKINNDKKLYF